MLEIFIKLIAIATAFASLLFIISHYPTSSDKLESLEDNSATNGMSVDKHGKVRAENKKERDIL